MKVLQQVRFVHSDLAPNQCARYGFGYWAAIEKATDELIGWIYFRSAPDEPNDTAMEISEKKADDGI